MFEQAALFRGEELSAQKPTGSRELKESARLPNLGLQGPILHHAKTPRPGTSIQISACSLCRSLCLFSPMQDFGSHCVPSPLSPWQSRGKDEVWQNARWFSFCHSWARNLGMRGSRTTALRRAAQGLVSLLLYPISIGGEESCMLLLGFLKDCSSLEGGEKGAASIQRDSYSCKRPVHTLSCKSGLSHRWRLPWPGRVAWSCILFAEMYVANRITERKTK